MFAQILMNTKSIQMTWLNDLWKKDIIRNQIEIIDNLERPTLLKKTNTVRKYVIAFSATYGPTLPEKLLLYHINY